MSQFSSLPTKTGGGWGRTQANNAPVILIRSLSDTRTSNGNPFAECPNPCKTHWPRNWRRWEVSKFELKLRARKTVFPPTSFLLVPDHKRITFAPRRGAILMCCFEMAYEVPEMDKYRPAIVVSIDAKNHKHAAGPGVCTLVPLSTVEPTTVGPEDVPVPAGKYWTIPKDSWVKCRMVATMSHERLGLALKAGREHRTEFVDASDMEKIETALKFVLGIT